MENTLKNEIKRLCRQKAIHKQVIATREKTYQDKFTKRTGITAGIPKASSSPEYPHRHFDPAYCARNRSYIARSIWEKVKSGEYRPQPALNFQIPKPSGGFRSIMSFSIPDSALANIIMWRARQRNLKRMSPFSYAYHPDKNVFDAVLALSGFITDNRLFAVQIDFEKYFDSIPTSYIKDCIDDEKLISLTPDERTVFKEFLNHKYANLEDYKNNKFSRRVKGTPQGSSLSLLLANLSNHQLDQSLERQSGRFVRYADDVVALCSSYAEAESIEKTFVQHCCDSGLIINQKKSPGIAIISEKDVELRNYQGFDYLGYRFTKNGLGVPEHIKARIISKLSRLIHIYLIHAPKKYGFDKGRCKINPDCDFDLVGLISEIRGYLYGGLKECQISNFLNEGKKLNKMRGLMGFYALLENKEELRALDGWLTNNIYRTMRKRHHILKTKYSVEGLLPSKEALIKGTWFNPQAWPEEGSSVEPGLPSFVRGWRAARKYFYTFGLEDVQPPNYGYY